MTDLTGPVCLTFYLLVPFGYLIYRIYRGITVIQQQRLGFTPKRAFDTCHGMLDHIVLRAWELLPDIATHPPTNWDRFTVSESGVLFVPEVSGSAAVIPLTEWQNVSGVGLEMRPLYDYAPATKSFWHIATRINTGYQFSVLVVPYSGTTITIPLPLRNNAAALEFAAHLLAFAHSRQCRLSLMGFDKRLTEGVVHLDIF